MTQAQNRGNAIFDGNSALLAYQRARRSDPQDMFMDWFERQGVAALRFAGPIDLLDVGTAEGELTFLILQALTARGTQVRSVTCVEPNPFVLDGLESNVQCMGRYFPDTSFHIVPDEFEKFTPTGQIPSQFHLVMANHVYPYLSDQEHCFARLTGELPRSNGYTMIAAQMPVGICAVVQELCEEPTWLYRDHIFQTHMGVLEEWARKSGVRWQRDVLWGDGIDVSPCFLDSKDGQLILGVLVGHSLLGCPPEILNQAREAVRHHSRPSHIDPAERILPDPFGVLVVYGKDAKIEPALPSKDRTAKKNKILNSAGRLHLAWFLRKIIR